MKLLVVLALLGAASAQYQLYQHRQPLVYNRPLVYGAAPYAANPLTYGATPYTANPLTYGARPYYAGAHYNGLPYTGLPYAFQKVAEKSVVQAREKREVKEETPAARSEEVSPEVSAVPLTYSSNPFTTFASGYTSPQLTTLRYNYPAVHGAGYTPYSAGYTPYHAGYTPYHAGYTPYHAGHTPLVHSIHKRSAEDQTAEDATFHYTTATSPFAYNGYNVPTVYSGAYPGAHAGAYAAPTVYNRAHTGAFPYHYNGLYNNGFNGYNGFNYAY